MFITGLLLKARYRLPSERKAAEAAQAAREKPGDARPEGGSGGPADLRAALLQERCVLGAVAPQFVVTRSNDADTLRIRSGPKEDVFVLYGVDAAQVTWTHPRRIAGQAAYFGGVTQPKVLDVGAQALAWVTQLLTSHPFIVYTKWARVPETERYYAFVRVQMDGKQQDLGELLVKNGYAAPNGPAPDAVPEVGRTPDDYHRALQKILSQAKAAGAGVWGHVKKMQDRKMQDSRLGTGIGVIRSLSLLNLPVLHLVSDPCPRKSRVSAISARNRFGPDSRRGSAGSSTGWTCTSTRWWPRRSWRR